LRFLRTELRIILAQRSDVLSPRMMRIMPPRAPVLPALAPRDQRAICELATASTIADCAWAGRGVVPIGDTKGMA
jgi:hypothetical protein